MSKQKTEEAKTDPLEAFSEAMDKPAHAAPARRGLDPELQAMAKIDRILADFSDQAVTRILGWILGKNKFAKTRIEDEAVASP